jgi:hypothetical protein
MTSSATLKPQAPQAAFRWLQVPVVNADVIIRRDGSMAVLEDEVSTSEVAKLLGCSVRHVQSLCDDGRLVEERDWRKLTRRAAVLNLRLPSDTAASQPSRGVRIHFKRFG